MLVNYAVTVTQCPANIILNEIILVKLFERNFHRVLEPKTGAKVRTLAHHQTLPANNRSLGTPFLGEGNIMSCG